MHSVILSIGANANKERNIRKAKELLREMFADVIRFSRTMETEPVGVKSAMYANLAAMGHTPLTLEEVRRRTKAIERSCGDTAEKRKGLVVEMDIDVLAFDGERHHEKDWERAYIKELTSDFTENEE